MIQRDNGDGTYSGFDQPQEGPFAPLPAPVDNVGTHVAHCCFEHGCKYGNDHCPVESGAERQEHPCEECGSDQRPGEVRRIEVQFKNRKGEWQVAVLQTAIGNGVLRNTWLSFADGEVETPSYEAYQGGCAYHAANPDAELRVVEIVETPRIHLTALILDD
jgi:hypothetical protein